MALGLWQKYTRADSRTPQADNAVVDIAGQERTLQGGEKIRNPRTSDSDDTPPKERKFSRVGAPVGKPLTGTEGAADSGDYDYRVHADAESGNAIQYRTCSWQKTAALLFSEYICLAIMSFPYSYATLGLVPGLIFTVLIAAIVLYTSLIVWEMCIRHPECKDVCDVAEILFGNKAGRYFTITIFLLNNVFIQGFHCLVGAKYLNTMTGGSVCTVGFSAIIAVIGWLSSMPRTFSALSILATASAFFTFISVLLATVFAAIEEHPAGYPKYHEVSWSLWPLAGTTFVAGMNGFLNILYVFNGQLAIPSFIAEMKNPNDFPKALWIVTIAEIAIFSVVGSVIYVYTGNNYNTSPAFGSIGNELYQKVSFSFMIPTIIFLGVLYASISSRFIFNSIFQGTKHMTSHTVVGWASWAGILAVTWVVAFIIAEVIPFFSDLLSLMSSLFDSFFGFVFWGWAYIKMRRLVHGPDFYKTRGARGYIGAIFAVVLIIIGFFVLTVGTYATVQNIIDGYKSTSFGGPFSCASNGLAPA